MMIVSAREVLKERCEQLGSQWNEDCFVGTWMDMILRLVRGFQSRERWWLQLFFLWQRIWTNWAEDGCHLPASGTC